MFSDFSATVARQFLAAILVLPFVGRFCLLCCGVLLFVFSLLWHINFHSQQASIGGAACCIDLHVSAAIMRCVSVAVAVA